jgi:hypothetical protein
MSVRREAEIIAYKLRGRLRYAESEEAKRLLGTNPAVLRSDATILVSEKLLPRKGLTTEENDNRYLKLLRAIIHEEIETIMQIMAKNDEYGYKAISELILGYFPPENRDPYFYLNHLIAKAFELLILTNPRHKLINEDELPEEDKQFLRLIRPIVNKNKHYFTGEFWDWRIRETKIRVALANGQRFYQVASVREGQRQFSFKKKNLAPSHITTFFELLYQPVLERKGLKSQLLKKLRSGKKMPGLYTSRHLLSLITNCGLATKRGEKEATEYTPTIDITHGAVIVELYDALSNLTANARSGEVQEAVRRVIESPAHRGTMKLVADQGRTAGEILSPSSPAAFIKAFYKDFGGGPVKIGAMMEKLSIEFETIRPSIRIFFKAGLITISGTGENAVLETKEKLTEDIVDSLVNKLVLLGRGIEEDDIAKIIRNTLRPHNIKLEESISIGTGQIVPMDTEIKIIRVKKSGTLTKVESTCIHDLGLWIHALLAQYAATSEHELSEEEISVFSGVAAKALVLYDEESLENLAERGIIPKTVAEAIWRREELSAESPGREALAKSIISIVDGYKTVRLTPLQQEKLISSFITVYELEVYKQLFPQIITADIINIIYRSPRQPIKALQTVASKIKRAAPDKDARPPQEHRTPASVTSGDEAAIPPIPRIKDLTIQLGAKRTGYIRKLKKRLMQLLKAAGPEMTEQEREDYAYAAASALVRYNRQSLRNLVTREMLSTEEGQAIEKLGDLPRGALGLLANEIVSIINGYKRLGIDPKHRKRLLRDFYTAEEIELIMGVFPNIPKSVIVAACYRYPDKRKKINFLREIEKKPARRGGRGSAPAGALNEGAGGTGKKALSLDEVASIINDAGLAEVIHEIAKVEGVTSRQGILEIYRQRKRKDQRRGGFARLTGGDGYGRSSTLSRQPLAVVTNEAQKLMQKIQYFFADAKQIAQYLPDEKPLKRVIRHKLRRLVSTTNSILKKTVKSTYGSLRRKKANATKNRKRILNAISNTFEHFIAANIAAINLQATNALSRNEWSAKYAKAIEEAISTTEGVLLELGKISEVRLTKKLDRIYVPGVDDIRDFPMVMRTFKEGAIPGSPVDIAIRDIHNELKSNEALLERAVIKIMQEILPDIVKTEDTVYSVAIVREILQQWADTKKDKIGEIGVPSNKQLQIIFVIEAIDILKEHKSPADQAELKKKLETLVEEISDFTGIFEAHESIKVDSTTKKNVQARISKAEKLFKLGGLHNLIKAENILEEILAEGHNGEVKSLLEGVSRTLQEHRVKLLSQIKESRIRELSPEGRRRRSRDDSGTAGSQSRGEGGRFGHKEGGNMKDALDSILGNATLRELAESGTLTILKFREVDDQVSYSTNRRDLGHLVRLGYLTCDTSKKAYQYKLTNKTRDYGKCRDVINRFIEIYPDYPKDANSLNSLIEKEIRLRQIFDDQIIRVTALIVPQDDNKAEKKLFEVKIPSSWDAAAHLSIIDKIDTFILKFERHLGQKEVAIHETLDELAENVMEHGGGGTMTIFARRDETGRILRLRITSKDDGRGLEGDLNEILKRSEKMQKTEDKGYGLINIVNNPDIVVIETSGQKWTNYHPNNDAVEPLRCTGKSNIVKGTKITLLFNLGLHGDGRGPTPHIPPDSEGPIATAIRNLHDGWKLTKIPTEDAATKIMEEILPRLAYSDENVLNISMATEILKEWIEEKEQERKGKKLTSSELLQLVLARDAVEILTRHEEALDQTELRGELRSLMCYEIKKVYTNGNIGRDYKLHYVGIHLAGEYLILKPLDGENLDPGFKAFHGEEEVARYDKKEGKIKRLYEIRTVSPDGYLRWRYKKKPVGTHLAGEDLILKPFDGKNLDSGYRAFHGEKEVARYNEKEGTFERLSSSGESEEHEADQNLDSIPPPAKPGSRSEIDLMIADVHDKFDTTGSKEAARRIMEEVLPRIAYSEDPVHSIGTAIGILQKWIEKEGERTSGEKLASDEPTKLVFAREAVEILARHEEAGDQTELRKELRNLVCNMAATMVFFVSHNLNNRIRDVIREQINKADNGIGNAIAIEMKKTQEWQQLENTISWIENVKKISKKPNAWLGFIKHECDTIGRTANFRIHELEHKETERIMEIAAMHDPLNIGEAYLSRLGIFILYNEINGEDDTKALYAIGGKIGKAIGQGYTYGRTVSELTASLEFRNATMALRETSREGVPGYDEQAAKLGKQAAEHKKTGQSLILYADDLLESAVVLDLESTVRDTLAKHNILKGGKIVLFAKNPANATILDRMIKHADPNIQTVIITNENLKTKNVVNGSEFDEIKAIVELAQANGARKILGIIRKPVHPDNHGELDDIYQFAKHKKIPIVFVGAEKGLYSFAWAVRAAMKAKSKRYNKVWLILLPSVRSLSGDIEKEYEEYLRSLHTLQAA